MSGAFPVTTNPVTITLFRNVPFDNTYKHHSFLYNFKYNGSAIGSNRSQRNFLYRKHMVGGTQLEYYYHPSTLTDTFNFDFKNGLVASLYLSLTNEQTLSNYMEVKIVSGNTSEYWYYFITNITQSNNEVFKLDLECDVLMTYGDAFMEGMKDIPVYTARKHDYRFDNRGYAFSWDYKSGDTTFAGIKPSIVSKKDSCDFIVDGLNEDSMTILKKLKWLYITRDKFEGDDDGLLNFKLKNFDNPFVILCLPIGCTNLIFRGYNQTEYYSMYCLGTIAKLISDGRYKSAKISSYPPFTTFNGTITYGTRVDEHGQTVVDESTIYFTSDYITKSANDTVYCNLGNNDLRVNQKDFTQNNNKDKFDASHFMIFRVQNDFEYKYSDIVIGTMATTPSTSTILSNKMEDTKLQFPPFKKYCLTSASGEETEVHLELLTSLSPFLTSQGTPLSVSTITTMYGGDYTYFTYIKPKALQNGVYGFANYKNAKIGLSTTNNYTIPVGENALDVWKSTQSQTYYNSKVASGIASGLQIAGGIGLIVAGAAATGASAGTASPVGGAMIAAGASAIASGIGSEVTNLTSINSKIEDLKNTPDSINVSGASYAHDLAMDLNDLHPYFITYDITPNIKYTANEFLYKYGYEVGRDCYFNYNLTNNFASENAQTSLFTRTIFNYIQISEDITNKIDTDLIPFVCKQKLSQIFNNGITLWTFIGFTSLQDSYQGAEQSMYGLNRWLFKTTLENKEYGGETF